MAISVTIAEAGAISETFGVELTLQDMSLGYYYTLTRSVASGHYPPTVVRGYSEVANEFITWDRHYISSGSGTDSVFDFSAPINETYTYTLERYAASDLLTPVETASDTEADTDPPPTGFAMISDPFSLYEDGLGYGYAYNVTGSVTDFRSVSRSANTLGSHHILGRTNPVVINDRMNSRSGTIVVTNIGWYTYSVGGEARTSTYNVIAKDETHGWNTLFEDGRTLHFRSYWKDTGIDDFYFKPTSIEIARAHPLVGNYTGTQTPRQYTIDFVEVDGYALIDTTDIAANWQTVANNNTTWADVAATHADWASVLADPTL